MVQTEYNPVQVANFIDSKMASLLFFLILYFYSRFLASSKQKKGVCISRVRTLSIPLFVYLLSHNLCPFGGKKLKFLVSPY